MIVYEVDLEIREDVFVEYRAWLDTHVATMLALPGFTGAEVLERVEPPPPPGTRALAAIYRLSDEAALRSYLAHEAPRMRAEGVERFGDAFRASRRVLAPSARPR